MICWFSPYESPFSHGNAMVATISNAWIPNFPMSSPDRLLEAAGSQELGAGRHAMVPRMKQPEMNRV